MINLPEIEKFYPENLRSFKKSLLREYLQYKILQVIFNSLYATKLSFLGGTALRIVHGNSRFSEDLDFDNFDLSQEDFNQIATLVQKKLTDEGYLVETRNVFKGAYRCYVKIPRLLYDNKLSGLVEEKILIQLDTAAHHFVYKPKTVILNKFDVFTEIFVTPPSLLLSQKIYAIFDRKSAKGRDFYDTVFLLSFNQPDYNYLEAKCGIKTPEKLRQSLQKRADLLDLKTLALDLKPFLFDPSDVRKVELFKEFIKTVQL